MTCLLSSHIIYKNPFNGHESHRHRKLQPHFFSSKMGDIDLINTHKSLLHQKSNPLNKKHHKMTM